MATAGEDFRDAMRDIQSSSSNEQTDQEEEANGDGDVAETRSAETPEESMMHSRIMGVDADSASVPELRGALKHAQGGWTKAHSTLLALCRRIQELEEELAQAKSKKKATSMESKVITIGRQFIYLFRLAPPSYLFPLHGVEPLDPRHPSRFKSVDKKRRCLVTEFVKFLSPELRKAIVNFPNFQEKFLFGVRSEIGTMVNSVKSQYPRIYTGLHISNHGLLTAENLTKDPTVKWLLQDPFKPDDQNTNGSGNGNGAAEGEGKGEGKGKGKGDSQEEADVVPIFPRILFQHLYFPDGDELFRQEALINAAKGALFGPTALTGRGGAGGSKPKATRWGIKASTTGLISNISVLVIHRLTPDQEFHSPGKVTHVNWEARCDEYLSVLNRNPDWTNKLLAYWDSFLFPSQSNSSKTTRAAPRDPIDHANSLFDKLQIRSSEPSEPGPDVQAPQIQEQIGQPPVSRTDAPALPGPTPSATAPRAPLSSASAARHGTPTTTAPMVPQPQTVVSKPARRTRQMAQVAETEAQQETQAVEPTKGKRTRRTRATQE
ncbi:hypothetical protein CONPUDRAFT_150408 [Coniophora puteana RWD-64-598 SS2]|uniref:Uncharacterized protein n=1 Tax=Coniophora puteana (strain RWD-64-598) TaxID=741705 RepID=A0A5M3N2J4_CONPW|nr:uncharacterized protein CONPUDRAFT_150408 [Coniophora puteana RWD-64-598 SS2]EIW85603.1 hypothetical protein CONPUDRAFT_150408 [Coniophora puteana RWD-64-598 SS2]